MRVSLEGEEVYKVCLALVDTPVAMFDKNLNHIFRLGLNYHNYKRTNLRSWLKEVEELPFEMTITTIRYPAGGDNFSYYNCEVYQTKHWVTKIVSTRYVLDGETTRAYGGLHSILSNEFFNVVYDVSNKQVEIYYL